MKRLRSLSAICVLAAMTACTTGGASPAPTPTTTPTLPAASSAPSPSSNPSQEALIEEAIAVYKRSFEARWKQFKAGGLAPDAPVPASFSSTMSGDALDRALAEQYDGFLQGIEIVSGDPTILDVRSPATSSLGTGIVGLESCEDGRAIKSRDPDGLMTTGALNKVDIKVERSEGKLTVVDFENTEVEQCALG